MASPSTVLTRGYGSWGSVNEVVTLGYGVGAAAEVHPGGTFTVEEPGITFTNRIDPGKTFTATDPGTQFTKRGGL